MHQPLISLCLIVGNVADYIERCLRSFAPIADEIVIVRAIGCQTPDDTMAIASRICAELGRDLIVGEYRNAEGHDWPHVDNFAAARKMSYDLSSGTYCFWADSDDVLKCGAEHIREHALSGEHPVMLCPYEIFARGISITRPRMMRRKVGEWRYRVHENFELTQDASGVTDCRIVVQHLPHNSKSGSNERNLRILEAIPEAEMNGGLWFHLSGEYFCAHRENEAVAAARRALEDASLGVSDRYELYINLASHAENVETAGLLYHQAWMTDPTRREAIAMMVENALDRCENEHAMAYAQQMLVTRKEAGGSWNDRADVYSWLGAEIYTHALRANKRKDEADEVRRVSLAKSGGPTIALVHATRGRLKQAAMARKTWIALAAEPGRIEHIFCLDDDDYDSGPLLRFHNVIVKPGGGCVAAWNAGAAATEAPIIVQMSDDWMPPPKWDQLILERIGDVKQPRVLSISDGHRTDRLICMAICTRTYYEQDGYLFHPRFTGVWSDNWFTHRAYQRGQVIEARDIVFEHRHPAFGTAEVDATYAAQNAPERYDEGLRIFDELLAEDA